MFVMSRIGYCKECARTHRPKSDQLFLARGSSSMKYKVLKAERNGTAGYTPHLYQVVEVVNKVVFYVTICTMNNCGTYLIKKGEDRVLTLDIKKWSKVMFMGIKDWKALLRFKDTGYQI